MVDKMSASLLSDTLNLVQLARETARVRGNQGKAEKLGPVVEQLQTLVKDGPVIKAPQSPGILGQSDFQALLSVGASKNTNATNLGSRANDERRQVVTAMADGGMNEIDIARQMGMTRDEVQLVLNLANIGKGSRR
jgi:hypothetical protein